MEERLDKILLQRGLVSSRVRAEQLIREVGVKVNGKLITKTGKKFPLDCSIDMIAEENPWVSRGAYKLLESIEKFNPDIEAKTVLDIGSSTGGFTEVLLHHGAKRVFAVDVGSNQLHPKLRIDNRVVSLEKTHVRDLTSKLIPEYCDACVIDVSFISLEKVFPFLHPFLKQDAWIIALLKPQFELGKENLGKGGIVKNKALYPELIDRIASIGALNNLEFLEYVPSPILGGDGNEEFLLHFKRI
ncbi:MAG: TlyA family RNA methyltransferase [Cryomorphaceae bacterium]|jgi:23S rRNA (cytidine1920-2'-O)/16S rRNA (cytidine1409-2'-O)-methyltransferase|nr:TlyA family RNA methyltransferase [Cryomorphaceae bacterium]